MSKNVDVGEVQHRLQLEIDELRGRISVLQDAQRTIRDLDKNQKHLLRRIEVLTEARSPDGTKKEETDREKRKRRECWFEGPCHNVHGAAEPYRD